jgi:hypothetical protein
VVRAHLWETFLPLRSLRVFAALSTAAILALLLPFGVDAAQPPITLRIVLDLPAEQVWLVPYATAVRLEAPAAAGSAQRRLRVGLPGTQPLVPKTSGLSIRLAIPRADLLGMPPGARPIRLVYQDRRAHWTEVAGVLDPKTAMLTARIARIQFGG